MADPENGRFRFSLAQLMLTVTLCCLLLGSGLTCRRRWTEPFAPHALAYSADGEILAAGFGDGTVTVWDLSAHRQLAVFSARSTRGIELLTSAAWLFPLDTDRLVTVSGAGSVKLWNVRTGKLLGAFRLRESPEAVALLPGGKSLAAWSEYTDSVELWDVPSQTKIGVLKLRKGWEYPRARAFSPDGRFLAKGDEEGSFDLWDVGAKQRLSSFELEADVDLLAISPDGTLLAAVKGSFPSDSYIILWDVLAKKKRADLLGYGGAVEEQAFSPDGGTLAAADSHGTVKLWNTDTGTLRHTLAQHSGQGVQVGKGAELEFSPDGKTLAVGTHNAFPLWSWGAIRLWNVANAQQEAVVWSNDLRAETAVLSLGFVVWFFLWRRQRKSRGPAVRGRGTSQ